MRLNDGVKWRTFDDGLVVYVPATCETHILPPHFAAFFCALTSQKGALPFNLDALNLTCIESGFPVVSDQLIEELISLKIVGSVN